MVKKAKKVVKEIKIPEITQEERKRMQIDGIKKTIVPAILGTFWGVLFFWVLGSGQDKNWFSVLLLMVLLSYYIQKLVYPRIGVEVREFEKKDWLYVEFLTLNFCLVVWTLLLN